MASGPRLSLTLCSASRAVLATNFFDVHAPSDDRGDLDDLGVRHFPAVSKHLSWGCCDAGSATAGVLRLAGTSSTEGKLEFFLTLGGGSRLAHQRIGHAGLDRRPRHRRKRPGRECVHRIECDMTNLWLFANSCWTMARLPYCGPGGEHLGILVRRMLGQGFDDAAHVADMDPLSQHFRTAPSGRIFGTSSR